MKKTLEKMDEEDYYRKRVIVHVQICNTQEERKSENVRYQN